ncbi:P-type conjugative transfer protein TrbJ [Xanthomonas arboricola pv. corylina]|uniref:P-type conjugative transfer protein TrbJ n=1 Tax=Xanthomonas TaxID=338 RepID=UPI000CEE2E48|nr:P-type conjugative transfer protein TrbJ [Xanthomonas arboricola]PPU05216.1 P-type conjugative transfer protein TrbJ [Xanthomonas arboricola pv. corylina]
MKAHKTIALAIAVAVAGVTITHAPPAAAQWVVVDPTNYVANFMTQLRAVQSNINEVQQIAQQIQQVKYMAENSKSLGQGDWDRGADNIGRLANLLQTGNSLAVSGKDYARQFQTMFPGYKAEKDFSGSYDKWNTTTRDSVLGAMSVANLQTTGFKDEQQALAALKQAAGSTSGQKQAMDAANQIALAQVNQMQNLRELMVAQMQAEGTYIASQTQAAQAKESSIRDATQYRDPRAGFKPKPITIGN